MENRPKLKTVLFIILLLLIVGLIYVFLSDSGKSAGSEEITEEENVISLSLGNEISYEGMEQVSSVVQAEKIKNWEMYKNEEYGVRFKYPSYWPTSLYGDTEPREEYSGTEPKTYVINTGALSVSIGDKGYYYGAWNESNVSLEEILENSPANAIHEEVVINDIKGTKVTIPSGPANYVTVYVQPSETEFVTISYPIYGVSKKDSDNPEIAKKYNECYEKIISSLTFNES